MRRLLVPGALGGVALVWGVAFVAIKRSLEEVSPTTVAVLRFAIAVVILAIVMAVWPRARPRIPRDAWWRIVVLGITGVPAYHLALNWGEQRTSASIAAIVIASAPVMVAFASPVVLGERVTARGVAGISLAFGGVALLATQSQDSGGTQIVGFLVTMLASVAWAVYTLVAKPLMGRVPSLQVTIAGMLTGSVFLLPFVSSDLVRETRALSAEGWLWILWLGVGASALGYVLFNYALTHLSATKTSVAVYMVPVVALVSAALILDEPLGPITALAAALVIAGVILTQRGGVRPREAATSRGGSEDVDATRAPVGG